MKRITLVLAIALLIVLSSCSSSYNSATATSPATTTPTSAATGNTMNINLTAQNVAFDQKTITVKAGAQITINFNNKDSMPHNVAIYTDQTATQIIFKGETFNGPATKVYTFTAPTTAGTYFFRCDVHPSQMTGSFIVTAN